MSTRRPAQSPSENLVLFSEEDLEVDRVAFDEMNIVELPFSLLRRNTDGIYEIPLSADGRSTLACLKSSRYGLPNSLAPKVLLGLMWLWSAECDPSEHTFNVKLRHLVERCMYPGRFDRYSPNGSLLRSVEEQIHCIAGARLHTDRWYMKAENGSQERGGQREVDLSIISDVVLLDKGGKNRLRVLRVTWGREFWKSMKNGYTKPLDARLVQSLESPLDLQLYRLLDRQLCTKRSQAYSDILEFARFKLGMHGATLDRGGRTACNYVAKKLASSVKRLSRERFTVRLTIDRSLTPFRIRFEKVEPRSPNQAHEVVSQDHAEELVREFEHWAHGVPRDKPRRQIKESYRRAAQEWVDKYGVRKAKWMVAHCIRAQKERGAPPIQVFAGLQLYEASALGAYEKRLAEKAGQQRLAFEALEEDLWKRYQQALVTAFDKQADKRSLKQLEKEAAANIKQQHPGVPKPLLKLSLGAHVSGVKRERMNGFSRAEFSAALRKHQGLNDGLRAELLGRHGFDPLNATA